MLEEAANVDLLLRLQLANQALDADVRARPTDARAKTTEKRGEIIVILQSKGRLMQHLL